MNSFRTTLQGLALATSLSIGVGTPVASRAQGQVASSVQAITEHGMSGYRLNDSMVLFYETDPGFLLSDGVVNQLQIEKHRRLATELIVYLFPQGKSTSRTEYVVKADFIKGNTAESRYYLISQPKSPKVTPLRSDSLDAALIESTKYR